MIPINKHLLIDPIKHESFMASDRAVYEEIGTVLAVAEGIRDILPTDKVFFDSWLAVKYPKNEEEYYWLVRYEDIRAIEHHV